MLLDKEGNGKHKHRQLFNQNLFPFRTEETLKLFGKCKDILYQGISQHPKDLKWTEFKQKE